jgi:soluble lytic murein transglycosylase-like protein
MISPNLEQVIRQVARRRNWPEAVLLGLVQTESGGDQNAVRYEKLYNNLDRPGDWAKGIQSLDTEVACQRMSWGLGQIMGATARRFGFKGPFFTELCSNPFLNLDLCCDHLDRDRAAGWGLEVCLARYNGGASGNPGANKTLRNHEYVTKVLRAAERWK